MNFLTLSLAIEVVYEPRSNLLKGENGNLLEESRDIYIYKNGCVYVRA
jgi:hypothetical protein